MMTTTMPQVNDTDLFPVMKACEVLNICRNTLYKHERNGLIDSAVRADGRKVYPGSEIKRLFSSVSNM